MKRFIDLRGQVFADDDLPKNEQTPCFAFFDTIVDRFEMFDGAQTWVSFKDFTEDYRSDVGKLDAVYERLKGLTPEWVLNS